MKKKSVIITVIIAVLVIIGIVVALVLTNNNKKEEPKPEPTATPKPTAVTKEEITITFDADGGKEIESIKLEKGKTASLPTPEKEGYKFLGWYDEDTKVEEDTKFDKDVTLKAKWEEKPKATPTPSATPKPTPSATPKPSAKPTPTPKPADPTPKPVTYSCPEGYTLKDTNKCVKTTAAEDTCPLGWKVVNGECVNPNSPNPKGTRTCPTKTYGGWSGTGTYYEAGRGYCGYEELHSYIGQRDNCQSHGGTLAANNHCYKHTEASYTITCASNEKKFGNQEIAPGNGGGCYQVTSPIKKCPSGYKSDTGYGECADVKDATAK